MTREFICCCFNWVKQKKNLYIFPQSSVELDCDEKTTDQKPQRVLVRDLGHGTSAAHLGAFFSWSTLNKKILKKEYHEKNIGLRCQHSRAKKKLLGENKAVFEKWSLSSSSWRGETGETDVWTQRCAYIWESWGFSCLPSLPLSLPLLHAASQTALITVLFEAMFQNEKRGGGRVTVSSSLNFLQLFGGCRASSKLTLTTGGGHSIRNVIIMFKL